MDKIKGIFVWAKKHWIVTTIVLLLVASGVWYLISKNTTTKTTYQTSKVEKGTVVSTITASGKALSTSILPISTSTSGIVKKVYVKDGDKVYKGQKIAEITPDTDGELANVKAYASLLSAENSYRSSQASLANTYDQIKGHESDETFTQKETRTRAEVANDNAYNNLAQAKLAFQQTSPIIIAPYTGTISNINIVEGMVITASTNSTTGAVSSQRIATIKNNATPVVNVTISETDVPKVKIGQKATVTFDSITDKTFTGVVATVDRIGTTSSNVTSYGVNIKLDTSSDLILPNMAATASIILDTATDVLYVPTGSLVTENGEVKAKTLVNEKEVDVAVETGISSDTNTVIKSGLTEGQIVITGTQSTTKTTTTTKSVFSGLGGGGGIPR
jgi:macrolide-specific efflux system membrane fusion protein